MLAQGGKVMRRAVSLFEPGRKAEDRIPLAHHAITLDLGQNRCSSNRSRERVAMDDCPLRSSQSRRSASISKWSGPGSRRMTASRIATREAW